MFFIAFQCGVPKKKDGEDEVRKYETVQVRKSSGNLIKISKFFNSITVNLVSEKS